VNEVPRIAHGLNEAGHEMGELEHKLTETVHILKLVDDPERMNQLLRQLILKMQRKPEQKQAEPKKLEMIRDCCCRINSSCEDSTSLRAS
jgi:hypothetical protein